MKKLFSAISAIFATAIGMIGEVLAGQPRRIAQGGYVQLTRPYMNNPAGTVCEFTAELEASLIAQGLAVTSAGPATSGAQTTLALSGSATIAAAASSVTITNPLITANMKIFAVIAQAAADGTALYVARIVPAAGSVTIYVNAAATAATVIDWSVVSAQEVVPN